LFEVLFVATFWWQTRINLLRLFPGWQPPAAQIDYLIPFVYLSDICLVGIVGCWLLTMDWDVVLARLGQLRNWDAYDVLLQPLVWLGLVLAVAAVSIEISQAGAWGWYRWLKLIEGGVVAIWIVGRWQDDRRWRWYGGILLAGLGFESLMMIGEWWRQGSLGWQWLGEWQFEVTTPGIAKIIVGHRQLLRPMATFAHPNIAGGVLAVSLPLAWLWLRNLGSEAPLITTYISKVWLGVAGLALFLSFSRSAWLTAGILAGLTLAYYASVERSPLIWPSHAWAKIGASAALLVGLGWLAQPLVVSRFESLATTDTWSLGLRQQLSQVAWQLWRSSPWLGVGLNNFTLHTPELLYNSIHWQQPVHAVWLLVLSELGVLGLLALGGLWLSVLAWPLLMIWQARERTKPAVVLVLLAWLGVILLSLVDHYWWTNQQALLAVFGLGGGTVLLKRQLTTGLSNA
jgi:hypothetical protein